VDFELAYVVGDMGRTKEQVLEIWRQETARVGGVEIAFGHECPILVYR
jgi:hypothetical protein